MHTDIEIQAESVVADDEVNLSYDSDISRVSSQSDLPHLNDLNSDIESVSSNADRELDHETSHSDDSSASYQADLSSSDNTSYSDSNSFDTDSEPELQTENMSLSENEMQALKILACFQRHNLSLSASKDILKMMRSLFPASENIKILDLEYIYDIVNTNNSNSVREVHYCENCNTAFPDDSDIFKCIKGNCDGLRYKGSQSNQKGRDRQPRKCFLIADVKAQLRSLLKTPGILHEIEQCKKQINERKDYSVLTDITDGSEYRKLLEKGRFLESSELNYNLTAVLNTDGINLFSSSKVELWPIFIAINELSPKRRFARENLFLIGIWQGKGKPPFKVLMEQVGADLNELYNEGVQIVMTDKVIVTKLAVILGVFDLPAKASLLNMTYFNGADSCITCEEPGIRVKQGKGTSQCIPYREESQKAKLRTHEEVKEQMKTGCENKRVKGFKGVSGMLSVQSYDIVKGTVPDYMHGILLGVTNTLLRKWFSPSESGNDYFIGKHIKKVSKRLQSIKPPQSIERLPRDLEKHYLSLKATELQAWLLFYAIPCVDGILPDKFLKHFACLSEAVYILLGDNISVPQLEKAASLLNRFYADFKNLYGAGSCGLNVHNACSHLVWYVKLWGPLWAWSTFPFEDTNAALLEAAHGTGNVMRQIMNFKHAESSVRQKGIEPTASSLWKVNKTAENCDVCGKIKCFAKNEMSENVVHVVTNCIPESPSEVKKVDRVRVHGKQFSSRGYARMQRRICYFVLYESTTSSVGSLEYFIYSMINNTVYAVIQKHSIESISIGSHLTKVRATDTVEIIPADCLIDTLVYINVSLTSPPDEEYVSLMPSAHGHAILK